MHFTCLMIATVIWNGMPVSGWTTANPRQMPREEPPNIAGDCWTTGVNGLTCQTCQSGSGTSTRCQSKSSYSSHRQLTPGEPQVYGKSCTTSLENGMFCQKCRTGSYLLAIRDQAVCNSYSPVKMRFTCLMIAMIVWNVMPVSGLTTSNPREIPPEEPPHTAGDCWTTGVNGMTCQTCRSRSGTLTRCQSKSFYSSHRQLIPGAPQVYGRSCTTSLENGMVCQTCRTGSGTDKNCQLESPRNSQQNNGNANGACRSFNENGMVCQVCQHPGGGSTRHCQNAHGVYYQSSPGTVGFDSYPQATQRLRNTWTTAARYRPRA